MARIRSIKPEFFTHDELAEGGPLAHLLFAGLWVIADRSGRLKDKPKRIKVMVLPFYEADIDSLLLFLEEHRFILRYEIKCEPYIQIINWAKHQWPNKREPVSVLPSPPGTVPEQCRNSAGTQQGPYRNTTYKGNGSEGKGAWGMGEGDQMRSADSSAASAAVEFHPVEIPLAGKNADYRISVHDVEEWREAFPAVDIDGEIKKIRQHWRANPTKAKTPRGIRRSITGWLIRAQDKGVANRSAPKSKSRQVLEHNAAVAEKLSERYK